MLFKSYFCNIILRNHLIRQQLHKRSLTASYYVTTPIFYVNSSPHIGHVYTLLFADALNIYHRLRLNSNHTIFSSGTDEHGIKIQNAADSQGINYRQFCDLNSSKFFNLFNQYDTTLTHFIRTSSDEHKISVKNIWNELYDKGYIYRDNYSGWYCASDETFVPESQVVKKENNDGDIIHVDQNDNQVIWSSEVNYMFKLDKFIDKVLEWLINEKPIIPEKFNTEAIGMIKRSNIGDISISRPKKRLSWGIEVPNDSSQTIYVWLDALTNYLTVVGYLTTNSLSNLARWPIDCQVIGKDIIKFHAIYWPAFLIALSLPLPKKLICHSHWLIENSKMSKSRGNVVDPNEENKLLTIEGLRYYLLRGGTPHSDTDYNRTQALRSINSDLADTYGNLLSRCCSPAINPDAVIPINLICNTNINNHKVIELKSKLNNVSQVVAQHYENGDFYRGIDEIMSTLRMNNSLYEHTKPWKLIKEVKKDEMAYIEYYNLQAITFETLRICSILLQPIIPKISSLALDKINVHQRSWDYAKFSLKSIDTLSYEKRLININCETIVFRRLKLDV